MMNVLNLIYSLPFVIGMLVGILGQRAYCHAAARHADKVRPLADGRKRRVGGISQQWLGGLIAIATVGYVVLTAQATQDKTVAISQQIAECNKVFASAIADRSKLTSQDAVLSNDVSDIRGEMDNVTSRWINRLLNPPPDIADLPAEDERRQHWNVDVTRVYADRMDQLRAEVEQKRQQRRDIAEERARNPLPSPTC